MNIRVHPLPFPLLLPLLGALALPASAADGPVDFAAVELAPVQLAENFHVIDESAGTGGSVSFLTGPDGILMVDSGIEPLAAKVEAAIRTVSAQPIRYVLNTHMHIDVTEGNEHFARLGATVISREEVRQALTHPVAVGNGPVRKPVPALTMPSVMYNGPLTLHFNGQDIRLLPVPRAHTDNDALVHFPALDIIVAGDILRPGSYPSINRWHGGTLEGMLDALAFLIGQAGPDTRIFTSHGEVVNRDAAVTQRDDILRVRDRVAALIAEGKTEQEVMNMYEAVTAGMFLDPRWEHTAGSRFLQDIFVELTRTAH